MYSKHSFYVKDDLKNYVQWLEMAEKDLNVVLHLKEYFTPTPHDVICYHCQQSIEKAMKAFLIY